MRSRVLALAALFVTACGDGKQCWEDSACGDGQRCHQEDPEEPGSCVECASSETYYDGVDNDCVFVTKDADKDSDGQTWMNAPSAPGGDCDDNDPTVNSGLEEACGDAKDNNCDGRVDEVECDDNADPDASFVQPPEGAIVSGVVTVEVNASDDTGVDRVELIVGLATDPIVATLFAPPYIFYFDSTKYPNGPADIRVNVVDFADRTIARKVSVLIDNGTTPAIEVIPAIRSDRRYGGRVTMVIYPQDPAGVDRVQVEVGTIRLEALPPAPFLAEIDTLQLNDGTNAVTVRAFDRFGNQGTRVYPITIDNTPPNAGFVTPREREVLGPGTHDFTVEASDASGIRSIVLFGNTFQGETGTSVLDTSGLSPGVYTYTATVADKAIVDDGELLGNVGTATVSVVIDDGTTLPCYDTVPLSLSAGEVSGTTAGGANHFEPGCGQSGAKDVPFEVQIPINLATLTATLDAQFPAVFAIYRNYCGLSSQFSCSSGQSHVEKTLSDVRAGDTVVLVVDGATANAAGTYHVQLSGTIGPDQPCQVGDARFTCAIGTCGPTPNGDRCPEVLDCADGIDNDRDGLTDESQCASPPVVSCPANFAMDVLSTTTLVAVSSSVAVTRAWTVESEPFGSAASVTSPTQSTTTFRPLMSGDYTLRYSEIDADFEARACETVVTARSADEFRVELIWNPNIPEESHASDVDLHLLHANGTAWWTNLDCYFGNALPEWDTASPDDNPRLDVDDTNGRGPENINVKDAPNNRSYRIGVHYFSDRGFGPAQAYVKVHCRDRLVATYGPVTLTSDQFWKVADVTVAAAACRLTPLSGQNGAPLIVTNQESRTAR